MLEQLHDHIMGELQQNARTDTVFVVTAVLFNLVVLGINSAVAGARNGTRDPSLAADLVFATLIVMTLLINGLAVLALSLGRQTRLKLLKGLVSMYRDNQVDKYYDPTLLAGYDKRYLLFTGIIVCLALAAILIPVIIRLV